MKLERLKTVLKNKFQSRKTAVLLRFSAVNGLRLTSFKYDGISIQWTMAVCFTYQRLEHENENGHVVCNILRKKEGGVKWVCVVCVWGCV